MAWILSKKDRVMSEKRKRSLCYHESRHALVGALICPIRPVQISIIPAVRLAVSTLLHAPAEEAYGVRPLFRAYLSETRWPSPLAVGLPRRLSTARTKSPTVLPTTASTRWPACSSDGDPLRHERTRLGPFALAVLKGGMFSST